jgi:hypothetical protein
MELMVSVMILCKCVVVVVVVVGGGGAGGAHTIRIATGVSLAAMQMPLQNGNA